MVGTARQSYADGGGHLSDVEHRTQPSLPEHVLHMIYEYGHTLVGHT